MSIAGSQITLMNSISDKDIFMLWYNMDSLNKVSLHLSNIGLINPANQKPFTIQTLSRHAFKWVIENSNEARPYFQEKAAEFSFNDDSWNKFLIRKAMYVYYSSKDRFLNWIDRMGFGTKYQSIYAKRYGL